MVSFRGSLTAIPLPFVKVYRPSEFDPGWIVDLGVGGRHDGGLRSDSPIFMVSLEFGGE